MVDPENSPPELAILNSSPPPAPSNIDAENDFSDLPPAYDSLFPLPTYGSLDLPPNYNSIYPPRRSIFQIFKEKIIDWISIFNFFYFADFFLSSFLLYISAMYFTENNIYLICTLTILTSYMFIVSNYFEKNRINRIIWIFMFFILLMVELILTHTIREAESLKEAFSLFHFCTVFSFFLSLNYICVKDDESNMDRRKVIFIWEIAIVLLPLIIMFAHDYITILAFIGLGTFPVILYLVDLYSKSIFHPILERCNIRKLILKDMLIYFIFTISYHLQLILEKGREQNIMVNTCPPPSEFSLF